MKARPIKNKFGEITGYQLRAYVGRGSNGKQIFESKVWKPLKKYTDKQLEKELTVLQLEFEKDIKAGKLKDGNITMSAFIDKWISEYAIPPTIKAKTLAGYKYAIKRIRFAFGNISLNDITPEIINKFVNNLREPGVNNSNKKGVNFPDRVLSDKTIKNTFSVLSSILGVATDWGYLKSNPCEKVKPPKVVHKKVKSLTVEETNRLFEMLSEAPLKYQVFIQLAIYSGLRNGEICGLTWNNIDFKRFLLTIDKEVLYTPATGVYIQYSTKTDENRYITIEPSFFEILKKYKDQCLAIKNKMGKNWNKNNLLFFQEDGNPIFPNTPYVWFTRWQKRNGFAHCSIHQLRHTNATLLILNGVNEKIVSGRLGHSNTSTTTNIYADYIKEADAMASQVIGKVLLNNKT